MGHGPEIIRFETWAWSWSWTWMFLQRAVLGPCKNQSLPLSVHVSFALEKQLKHDTSYIVFMWAQQVYGRKW